MAICLLHHIILNKAPFFLATKIFIQRSYLDFKSPEANFEINLSPNDIFSKIRTFVITIRHARKGNVSVSQLVSRLVG